LEYDVRRKNRDIMPEGLSSSSDPEMCGNEDPSDHDHYLASSFKDFCHSALKRSSKAASLAKALDFPIDDAIFAASTPGAMTKAATFVSDDSGLSDSHRLLSFCFSTFFPRGNKMATATAVLSEQQIEVELRQFQTEAVSIRKKLDDDMRKLEAAQAERQRLVAKIAGGAAESDVLGRVKGEMETLEIRIGEYKGLLAANRTKTDELGKELYRRQAEAMKAARKKEFADLKERRAALARKIHDLLRQLCIEDLPALDAIRRRLGSAAQSRSALGAARGKRLGICDSVSTQPWRASAISAPTDASQHAAEAEDVSERVRQSR
jgi:hypothetical protein